MQVSIPKPGESVWLWLLKLLSGVLVFTLIVVHIVVNHLVATNGLMNYADVVAYLSNPWIAILESTFLIIVVCHSLLGSRSILLDLNPSGTLLAWINRAFLVLGLVSIVYGIGLIRIIVGRGG